MNPETLLNRVQSRSVPHQLAESDGRFELVVDEEAARQQTAQNLLVMNQVLDAISRGDV